MAGPQREPAGLLPLTRQDLIGFMGYGRPLVIVVLMATIVGCSRSEPLTVATPLAEERSTLVFPHSQPTATPTLSPVPSGCEVVPAVMELTCTSPATGLQYWLYLPPAELRIDGRPPLLLYLHGFSHSGGALRVVLSGGVPSEIEQGRQLPMIVVSPQCPTGDNWQYVEMVEKLSTLIDEAAQTYKANPSRVYLTGFSMGGDGVWALGIAHAEQFAALVPVGSWYRDTEHVCDLRDVPVWVFQGEADEIVRPTYAKDMVAALTACGGQVDLTLLPGAGHDRSSLLAYRTDELYNWLAAQVAQ